MRHRWSAAGLAVVVGVLGILMAHHPMILSGLRRVQVNLGDTRFNNYVLEHFYRWTTAARHHTSYWDPPFFYPARNVAAYSDLLVSVAPVYVVFRGVGMLPDTAFQFWMIAMSGMNYLVAYHVLVRRLGVSVAAAAMGAFLFAFGAPRVNQLGHPQLLPQFLSLVTIDALFGIFATRARPASLARRGVLWLTAVAGVVAQLFAGFYLGWFLILALGIAASVALLSFQSRRLFLATLRRDAVLVGASAVVGGLLLWPVVTHYLAASREAGPRYYPAVRQFLPEGNSFFRLGPDSWLWGWCAGGEPSPLDEREDEKRLGIGPLTTLLCLLGLYAQRGRAVIRLLAVVGVILVLCVLRIPPGLTQGVCLTAILLALADASAHGSSWVALGAPALFFVILRFKHFYSEEFLGAALFSLLLVLADVHRHRGNPFRSFAAAVLSAGMAFWLFAPVALAYGVALAGLAGSAAVVARVRPLGRAALIGTVVLLVFLGLTAFGYRPLVLEVASLAPLFFAVARAAARGLPPRWTAGMLIGALLAATIFQRDDTAWSFVAARVPGAAALYAVSRVGVVLLVVWSIGLALFLERLAGQRRTALAAVLGLVCLLEQGVTTPSYDKAENREAVAALAGRVAPARVAFFYSPHHARLPNWKYHLDAMWAALECGVPTVNGYSGNKPRGWGTLSDPNIEEECDYLCLGVSLGRWISEHGLRREDVRWVGGPEDPRAEAEPP
jgi:hypothetical protein